jgi:excisionase family DNA binding protein
MSADVKPPVLLTVRGVAERLGPHEQSVRRKIHSGELPAIRLGGRGTPLRVDAAELDRWLAEQRTSAA